MSTSTPSPPQSTIVDQGLREASLIATFYGRGGEARNGSTEAIHRQLLLKLMDTSTASSDDTDLPDDYVSSDSRALLRRWEPASTHDAMVVQLALNQAGNLKMAWSKMREDLEKMLSAELLKEMWGYSLIYEAALAPSGNIERAFKALLPDVRRLYQPQPFNEPQPLAHACIHGGELWLVEAPLHGDSIAAGTIYIALSTINDEREFVQTVFYGKDATLLMPDLIAHKAYFHRRQYHTGGLHREYEAMLGRVRDTTDLLLQTLQQQRSGAGKTEELSKAYQGLARIMPPLNALHIRQLQQAHNYDYWRGRLNQNEILNYHLTQLQASVEELKLMVAEGRDQMDATRMALELAQTRIESSRVRGQERSQLLLAVLGSALAVPQLVDRTAAGEIALWIGIPMPETGYSLFQLMTVQLTLIIVLALISLAIVSIINNYSIKS